MGKIPKTTVHDRYEPRKCNFNYISRRLNSLSILLLLYGTVFPILFSENNNNNKEEKNGYCAKIQATLEKRPRQECNGDDDSNNNSVKYTVFTDYNSCSFIV